MLKKLKILIVLFCCGICCVSYAAKRCVCCSARVSEGVFERRFGGNWDAKINDFSLSANKDSDICHLRHMYAFCKNVDKESQIKYLKQAAKNSIWKKVQHINPKFFIIVDEYSLYEDILKKFSNDEPCRKKYCIKLGKEVLSSLRKDYKIKGKNGQDISVSAVQTESGYVAILDPETAWKHFYLKDKYREYKNMNWVVFRVHPCDEFSLVPEEKYDEDIYAEKWEVFKEICQELGAKKINFKFAVKDNKKHFIHVDGEASIGMWAKAKAAYDQIKESEKEIKIQTITEFEGDEPVDPCKDSNLKKWIENDEFFKSLRNRRIKPRNLLKKESATFSYQSIDKFSLKTSAEITVLWWTTLKTKININKEKFYNLEWCLEIEFPGQDTAKELESPSVSEKNISAKEIVRETSFWDITSWF